MRQWEANGEKESMDLFRTFDRYDQVGHVCRWVCRNVLDMSKFKNLRNKRGENAGVKSFCLLFFAKGYFPGVYGNQYVKKSGHFQICHFFSLFSFLLGRNICHIFDPNQLDFRVKVRTKFYFILIFRLDQLMVNCWFGLMVWDSRGTPKNPNPFRKRIPGIQTTGAPNQQLTTWWQLKHFFIFTPIYLGKMNPF